MTPRLVGVAAVAVVLGLLAAFVRVDGPSDDGITEDPRTAFFSVLRPRGEAIRQARTITISVFSGTCGTSQEEIAETLNAPLEVEVQDRPEAVVIRARIARFLPPGEEPPDPALECAGLGIDLHRETALPRPIGRRALLNGGFAYQTLIPQILVLSLDAKVRALLRTRGDRLRYMGIDRRGNPLP